MCARSCSIYLLVSAEVSWTTFKTYSTKLAPRLLVVFPPDTFTELIFQNTLVFYLCISSASWPGILHPNISMQMSWEIFGTNGELHLPRRCAVL